MFRALRALSDLIGETLYRREYRRRNVYTVDLEATRASNARYFDTDEDHCICPGACEVHP